MSESTVNFGLDVTTGNSTTSVDNLTTSVDGLLEKFTKLMTAMGKGDEVFGKVVKALGGHKGELDAAAREIDKIQKAMAGGTMSKGYTADISSEFKGLAQDLKSAISGIPVEIKAATTQISGMTTIMQNQLGGIGVTLRELKDSLLDVGNAADNTKRKTAQISGKPKIEGQTPDLGAALANKFNLEAKVQFRTEDQTIDYIQNILREADKLDKVLSNVSQNQILDQLLTKQRELLNLRKQAAYLKSPEDKAAISSMLLPLQEEIGLRKEQRKQITETQRIEAAKYDAGIARQLQQRKEVEAYFQKSSVLLKQQTLEQEQADKRKAVVAQNLAEAKLRITAQEKTQAYTDEYKKAGEDLQKLGSLSDKITQELIADQKNLGLVTRNASKETTQALKEEILKREELVRTIKEQEAVQYLGIGKSVGIGGVLKDIKNDLLLASVATEQFGKTSQNTIFESVADMKTYRDRIIDVREELVKALNDKAIRDPEIKEGIRAQIKELDATKQELQNLIRGLDITGTGFAANPEAIRLKEEIDLLNKYQDITDRVRQAKEKLNQTKGSKSDTLQARKEMEALRLEQELLSKEMKNTAELFKAAGLTGSKAMRDITAASTKLHNEMASFKGTISATESSFKNMWGSMSMALGKLMLYYHSLSVLINMIRGGLYALVSVVNGIMTISEPVTNLEKALRMMNETGGGIVKTRKEMEYFKKTANDLGFAYKDLAEGFKQFKDIADLKGGNYEGIMNIWKQMTAAARATGQSGDLQDFYKGFTDAIGKGQIMTEELKKQLAQRLPGLIKGVEKEIAAFRNIDVSKFNIFTAMEKGTVKLSEFMAAFENFLPKWSKLGESMGDAYSASIARLSNAWTDLMIKIATGPTGSKIISMVEDMTAKLKDRDIEVFFMSVVTSIAQIARYLTDIAENILPQIGQFVKNLPGINYDATVAAKNPKLVAAAQQSVSNISTVDLMWNTQQLSGAIGSAISRVLAADPNFAVQSQFNKTVNSLVALVASTDADKLIQSGWLSQNNKGGLVVAKSEAEAQAAQLSAEATQTAEGMAKTVFTPLSQYLVAVDGDMSKLNAKIEEALKNMRLATGVAGALSIESLYTAKDLSEFKRVAGGQSISNAISLPGYMREGSAPQIRLPKVSTAEGYGLSLLSNLKSGNLASVESATSASPASYAAYNRSEDVKGDADSKVKALAKSLENIQDQINKASMGKWAYEFAQVTHKLKEFEIELGDKAAPQIAELGVALRKEFGENFARGLEEFDTSLDMAIRSGKYGKELQTSFDSINKTYKDNLKKIEDDYKGISAVEATKEQLDKVAQLKTKAEQAKVAGYESAIEAAVVSEKIIAQVQIQGAEKTIQEVMAIRDKEAKDVVELEKALVSEVDRYSQEGYNRKVANIDKAVQAEIKLGVRAVDAFKWGERKKQEELDKSLELRIASTENFTDYLNMRFAKEQGMFDNPTVATTKQFEKMYDIIGSGASEMGQTIQESFTEAFTGTLKSWQDTWKSIQATFLKGLAAMMWEAKMRPIQLSIVSALTGFGTGTPALAGGSTAGQVASQAHDMVTGGSQATTGGLFSQLTKSTDKMTKAVNDFGKETLGLASDLTDAILGAGFGLGVAQVMFPESQLAKVGGIMGGAAGQIIGATFGTMGGPIGSAIGSVAGSMIGKLFQKETKVTDYGIRVSVDEQGLKFLDKYEKLKKSGGFSISSLTGLATFATTGRGTPLAWQSGSKRDRYSEVDPQVYKQISAAITTSFSTVSRQMLSLGLAPNFAGFSIDEKVSLKGEDPEALLQAWLNKLSGKMVDTALANDSVQASFAAAKKMGETSSDALTRLVEAMTALETGAIKANVSIEALAGGLSGMDLASFASDFSEALGGSSNVTAFFDQIAEFIGYVGIEGIANMTRFEEKFQTAIGNINSYSAMAGTRTSTLLGQQTELELTKSSIESTLEQFAAGGGWKKWLTFEDGELNMRPGTKYSTVEEMAAADPKWKAVLEPMIAYVKELKVTNQALENVGTKLEREGTTAPAAAINASSTTFWADYKKALTEAGSTGLPPELAAAWYEAGKVAEQIKEMGDAAKEAAESQRELMATYREQRTITERTAVYMKTSSDGLLEVAKQAQLLNTNDLPAWFKANHDQIYALVPGLEALAYEGETALETFNRLGTALMEIADAAGVTGTSLATISGGLKGIDLAGFAQELVDTFGSSGAVVEALQRYNSLVNTEEQQKTFGVGYWKQQATERIAALGTPEIDTTNFAESYKKAMEQGLTSEELYKWDYAAQAMENMADAAGTAADAISSLADYLSTIRGEIDAFGMTDTESFLKEAETKRKEMIEKIVELGGTSQEDVTSGKISVPDTAIADEWYQAALTDKISQMMEEAVKALDIANMTDYDQKMQAIVKTTQETIDSLTLLKASEEDIIKIRQLEAVQIKQLKEAHNEYIQSIQDKIDTFGLTDTESFLKSLTDEVNDMKKQLLETGGALADTTIAESYRIAAIQDKLSTTMQGITESIASLANTGYAYELQKINKTLQDSIAGIVALGGTEEDLAKARYLAQLQAQEIIKEAANTYITAYDDKLQEIEDLKNEKQALIDAVSSARSNYMQAIREEIDLKQKSIDKMQETVDSLKNFVTNMSELKSSLLTDAGFLSSAEKAGVAMANFQSLVNRAKSGDEEARSGLSSAASSTINSAKGGSYENYIKTFAQVYGQINSVQALAQADLDKMSPELEALTASRDSLQAIYDKLEAEEKSTLSINDANIAYENAKIALANSSLDAQIAAAQAEADRHKETVELLRLQYNEVVDLTSAARNYFDAATTASSVGLVDNTGIVSLVDKSSALNSIATATKATEKTLNATVDLAFKTNKIQDSIYKKTDELLYFMQEDNKKIYDSLQNLNTLMGTTYKGAYEYEESGVTKVDIGLKVIVSATQVKDSILLALREANDLVAVDSTSVIGLLTGIKTCACTCQCTGTTCTVDEYNETSACSAVNSVVAVADTSELATEMTDKAFSTISGAWGLASTLDDAGIYKLESVIFDLGAEDPDCAAYTYFIVPQTPMD